MSTAFSLLPAVPYVASCGGYIARSLGLPISRIVAATNANDIVARTLREGDLSYGPNVPTLSPAMDIQFAYNLERVLWFASHGDGDLVGSTISTLEKTGTSRLDELLRLTVGDLFEAMAVDDDATTACMRRYWFSHRYALCPHSAIAVAAVDQLQQAGSLGSRSGVVVCVATAHVAKFQDAWQAAVGSEPLPTTPRIDALHSKPETFSRLRKEKGDPDWRRSWIETIKAAVSSTAAASATVQALAGDYVDPNHPTGTRTVTVDGKGKTATLVGNDNPGGAPFHLTGVVDASASSVLVDFQPKGGPPHLLGTFDGRGISWPDGNRWEKTAAAVRHTDSEPLFEDRRWPRTRPAKESVPAQGDGERERDFGVGSIRAAVDALGLERIQEALRDGFVAHAQGRVQLPPVQHLKLTQNPDRPASASEVCIKTALLSGTSTWVTKVAGGAGGCMMVFDADTGSLAASLRDDGYLTELRTAVVCALVASHLSPPDLEVIGVVGTGIQARMQVIALASLIPCRQVLVLGRRRERAEAVVKDLEAYGFHGFHGGVTDDPYDLAQRCRLIITATMATQPLLPPDAIQPGTHITAMGADNHGKMELDPRTVASADLVVVDSKAQNVEYGEVAGAVTQDLLDPATLVELGDFFQPSHAHLYRRFLDPRVTIFDSTGVGVADAVIAGIVLRQIQQGIQTSEAGAPHSRL